jgi:hypothetical protein
MSEINSNPAGKAFLNDKKYEHILPPGIANGKNYFHPSGALTPQGYNAVYGKMIDRLEPLCEGNLEKLTALTNIDTYQYNNTSMSKAYMEYLCKLFGINSDQLFGLKPMPSTKDAHKAYFQNAKVGDEVSCTINGIGEISFISKGYPQLLSVNFNNIGCLVYDADGSLRNGGKQTLFYSNDKKVKKTKQ